jgi:phage shock protein PspC (stress-responsive transcriptional regulator)
MKFSKSIKFTLVILSLFAFMICQWLMDVSSWSNRTNCMTNGFIMNCYNVSTYHIAWYVSIAIYLITLLIMTYKISEG